MSNEKHPTHKSFTVFRSAAEEAEMKSEQENWDNEGGHMSSISGRIMQVPGADLPYVVTLTHQSRESTKSAFATMREAEAFIKRNTPVPEPTLSTTYDRPAADGDTPVNDETILARLKVIDRRLRQISTEDAASVLAGGLAHAGIHEQERLRLISETERILDELDARNDN